MAGFLNHRALHGSPGGSAPTFGAYPTLRLPAPDTRLDDGWITISTKRQASLQVTTLRTIGTRKSQGSVLAAIELPQSVDLWEV